MNLSDAIGTYLDARRGRKAKQTVRCDEVALYKLLRQTGNIPAGTLDTGHMESYFYDPVFGLATSVQSSTFNINRSRMAMFTRWLVAEGHVTTDPMRKVESRKALKKNRRRLSIEQMTAAIESCKHPRDRALVALACNTGLRISSILGLRVRSLDLDSGILIAPVPKTQQEIVMPITADLDGEMRLWLDHYRFELGALDPEWYLVPARHAHGWEGSCTLAPDKRMGVPWRVIHEAFEAIGVDAKGEGFHTMRRSAGRALFENAIAAGDPRAIHIVQAFYGHAEVRMTQNYIGTDEERRRLHELMRGQRFLKTSDGDVIDLASRRGA